MSSHLEHLNPSSLPKGPGYTQVVKARGEVFIFVSGQVALNAEGQLVGEGDLRNQAAQVFENLRAVLAAAGAAFDDVVKITYFVVNLKREDALLLREVRQGYLNQAHPPASTLVGVTALVDPRWLIEIEAVAVLPRQ